MTDPTALSAAECDEIAAAIAKVREHANDTGQCVGSSRGLHATADALALLLRHAEGLGDATSDPWRQLLDAAHLVCSTAMLDSTTTLGGPLRKAIERLGDVTMPLSDEVSAADDEPGDFAGLPEEKAGLEP